MNDLRSQDLDTYYEAAETWANDSLVAEARARRLAWTVALAAVVVAVLEAIALVALVPLKKEVPYTLLVDRQTGYVEALRPLDRQMLSPDAALTRSFLVQYVIAREGFGWDVVQENYRKVGLWSADEARKQYVALMKASNPVGPLAVLPRSATVIARIHSVSSLGPNRALVRFDTVRTDRESALERIENWAAVVDFRFSEAEMSADDRLVNPLGFQVTRYRKNPETLPVAVEHRSAQALGAASGVPPIAP